MITIGLPCTVSEINGYFGQNSQIFLSHLFNATTEAFPLEFCNGDGAKENYKDDPAHFRTPYIGPHGSGVDLS